MKTKISGVYKITNNITGDFYIGSSNNVKLRWKNHKSPTTWVYNKGMELYKAFIKYGLDSFTFEIIEETDNLREREQYFIGLLRPSYNNRRANGLDIERYKNSKKEYEKEYRQSDKGKESQKKYQHTDKGKKSQAKASKKYYSQLCLYEGEILTLSALGNRFQKQGIQHPFQSAKKYLLEE